MKWMCGPCGYIYDEDEGSPQEGIPAGTLFADLPADWKCPDCGVGKEFFYELAE
ncbi:MAG: rubredoxin [Brachymonas sp.]|nr:rubredoxin [Brachymonas sp.]